MQHKTTKDHYEKYASLIEKLHLEYTEDSLKLFNVENKEHLIKLYEEDHALNNIRLHLFDNISNMIAMYNPDSKGLSLSELVCSLKHYLIYQVIGSAPEFVTFDELFPKRKF
jgi:hypothetical protein